MTTRALRAYGRAVKARREELEMTFAEVTRVGGPTRETMKSIEDGHPTRPYSVTLSAVDKALAWTKGSSERQIDEGLDPVKLEDAADWNASPTQRHSDAEMFNNIAQMAVRIAKEALPRKDQARVHRIVAQVRTNERLLIPAADNPEIGSKLIDLYRSGVQELSKIIEKLAARKESADD